MQLLASQVLLKKRLVGCSRLSTILQGSMVPTLPPGVTGDDVPTTPELETETGKLSDYLAILSAVAAAAAIWGTVLGCMVTCCRRPTTRVCRLFIYLFIYLS